MHNGEVGFMTKNVPVSQHQIIHPCSIPQLSKNYYYSNFLNLIDPARMSLGKVIYHCFYSTLHWRTQRVEVKPKEIAIFLGDSCLTSEIYTIQPILENNES